MNTVTPIVPGKSGTIYLGSAYLGNQPEVGTIDFLFASTGVEVYTEPTKPTWRDRLLLVGLLGIFAVAGLVIALPAFI